METGEQVKKIVFVIEFVLSGFCFDFSISLLISSEKQTTATTTALEL